MNDMPWYKKAAIGASGGLCLSLLKLIDAGFYLDQPSSKQVLAGYLTYLSFVVIGSLVATFLYEHDVSKQKVMRNAFLLGLLGPSLLVAILKQPVVLEQTPGRTLKDIPKIGSLLVSPAYAQSRGDASAASGVATKVKILKKTDVEPTYKEAFLAAIGRPVAVKDYVYAVGVSDDPGKAVEAAQTINKLGGMAEPGLKAHVIKPAEKNKYYVIIGDLATPNDALEAKAAARAAAIGSLKGKLDDASKEAATLLLQGTIVKADSLL